MGVETMMTVRTFSGFAAAALAIPAASGPASADFVTFPGPNATAEGSQGQNFPFNARATSGMTSHRYQQVYAASEFLTAGDHLLIMKIAFRPDARIFGVPRDFGMPFSTTITDIEIRLSTTPRAVDDLSTSPRTSGPTSCSSTAAR
jgi:hypothetical protein